MAMASVNEVRSLLAETTVPQELIDDSLLGASAVWLMSATAEMLAGDLVLCHPPLSPEEVRAVAHPLDDGGIRLTVAAHDRPGLLADTAAVLAAEDLSVSAASAMSWTEPGLALQALTVAPAELTEERWQRLGSRLQGLGRQEPPVFQFTPVGRAVVRSSSSAMGRCVVTVTAPDQVGLLWAICRWFADQGLSIEAAHIGAEGGQVQDHFIVVGQPDSNALAARLTERSQSLPGLAVDVAGAVIGIGKGLVRRVLPR
jgi:[protein-PII] uridylyltransferase